jgi:hypothetical protein
MENQELWTVSMPRFLKRETVRVWKNGTIGFQTTVQIGAYLICI